MTELAEPDRGGAVADDRTSAAADEDRRADAERDPEATTNSETGTTPEPETNSEAVAARVRDRGERVRRRELETALRRLTAAADGEVTPARRRVLSRLSTRITDALVEQWAANLDDAANAGAADAEAVDADAALALLTE